MSAESASRRRVLTVLGVGGVAAIASQVGQQPASAATGDPMLLGSNNEADASTSLASGALGSALAVTNTNPTGFGISGIASGGVGVHGSSETSAGIAAHSASGPAGFFTTDTGHAIQAGGRCSFGGTIDGPLLEVTNADTGPAGGAIGARSAGGGAALAATATGSGPAVHGQAAGNGPCVVGQSQGGQGINGASQTGVGGLFSSDTGLAIEAHGPVDVRANVNRFVLAVDSQSGGGEAGAIYGRSVGGSPGIRGDAAGPGTSLVGVLGVCNEGFTEPNGIAVQGVSGYGPGQAGTGPGTGVEGLSGTGTGVHGSSETGTGMTGESKTGVGVAAGTLEGRALEVHGPAAFSTAGAGSIPSGQTSVFVANTTVTGSSHISVTLVSDPGDRTVRWVQRTATTGFRVHLTGPAKNKPAVSFTFLITEPM